MANINLEICGTTVIPDRRGTIPTGVDAELTLMADTVIGLRYPGRPDVIKPGHTLTFGIGGAVVQDLYVPKDVADRTYEAFGDMLRQRRLSREKAAQGLCYMAGVQVPEHVEWPGDKLSSKYAWRQPSLGDLKLETGYIAVNAENSDRPNWPFWTLNDHTRALTYVNGVGLAVVRAIDMLKVGNFIRPLSELR